VELAVPDPPLSDGVITLRPPREEDLPAIERGTSDPDVVRWMGPFDPAREVLERNLSRWADGTRATFSICDQTDVCLGHVWVILGDREDPKRGSVGYWLLPEARGNGFATRSVRLVSRWALGDLGLARLALFAEPSNEGSRRVARRSGYVEEGVLRSYMEIGDRRVDCVVSSLLPADLTSHAG
jgi:RimJ/RimL family protein N-acetyltransferase